MFEINKDAENQEFSFVTRPIFTAKIVQCEPWAQQRQVMDRSLIYGSFGFHNRILRIDAVDYTD